MARPKPAPEPDRYEPCERCGQAYLTAAWWQDTPICCYCYNQAKRVVGQCVECGHVGIVPGRTPTGRYLCRGCSGIRLNVDCAECGAEAELYRRGHCWRCELAHQVDELLTHPQTGTINPHLIGLAQAIKQMPRPNSGVTWLRSPTVRTVLRQIAAADAIDQHLLASLPVNRSATHIRALLDEHGIAGARLDYRTRFSVWADDKLATLTSPDNQLVMRSYIRWHLSRRFDDTCTNGTFLAAKQGVTVAIDFLNFLDILEIPIGDVDQSQVDTFIASGTETNRLLTRFLPWAIATYQLPPLRITPHQRGTAPAKTNAEQVEQLTRLFSNEELTPRDRLAAALHCDGIRFGVRSRAPSPSERTRSPWSHRSSSSSPKSPQQPPTGKPQHTPNRPGCSPAISPAIISTRATCDCGSRLSDFPPLKRVWEHGRPSHRHRHRPYSPTRSAYIRIPLSSTHSAAQVNSAPTLPSGHQKRTPDRQPY